MNIQEWSVTFNNNQKQSRTLKSNHERNKKHLKTFKSDQGLTRTSPKQLITTQTNQAINHDAPVSTDVNVVNNNDDGSDASDDDGRDDGVRRLEEPEGQTDLAAAHHRRLQ